jgi:addiction module HigA family antidote
MITMHPGSYLSMVYVEPLGLTQSKLAEHLQVDKSTVSRLLNEEAELTAKMAVRLSRIFDFSAEGWMEMQTQHSLSLARKSLAEVTFEPIPAKQAHEQTSAIAM